jgi:signal transduction histidine kinase
VLLVASYALIVSGLGTLLHNEANYVPSLIAAGVIAVLFQPAHLRLQRLVSRRLFGDRDDPAEVLTRLTDQLEAADSGESLMSNLVTTTASSLMLPYVAVWIRARSGGFELAAETGVRTEAVDVMPLMHQQELIGQLMVAPRSPGETLAPADRHLLIAIARLVATTARTVQLTDEVQEARIRTVSAREEERRRIRRDLHDGLGPVLAGQGLKLTAARHLLRERPEVAERLLDELMHQSEDTVAEIRRLVYALRPPTLDELGLADAIREHVETIGAAVPLQITLDVPEQLPEMPAAVEVAIFRIVQEALSNVIRHAQARQCTISLHMNGALDVMVVDDGAGLPTAPRRGVGLVSMQERAAEVGGICRIDNREQGGVRVWLTVPKMI